MSAVPCECGAVGDGIGGCEKCLGAGEVYGSGEAGGLEAVLAAQLEASLNEALVWPMPGRHRQGWSPQLAQHIAPTAAAAVRVWLTEALAAPEVVEAVTQVIVHRRRDGYADAVARAALSAVADVLRAGVTR